MVGYKLLKISREVARIFYAGKFVAYTKAPLKFLKNSAHLYSTASWNQREENLKIPVRASYSTEYVRGGADKSLARPGRKWATAKKLGI